MVCFSVYNRLSITPLFRDESGCAYHRLLELSILILGLRFRYGILRFSSTSSCHKSSSSTLLHLPWKSIIPQRAHLVQGHSWNLAVSNSVTRHFHTFCLKIMEGLLHKLDRIRHRGPYLHLVTHFLLHLQRCYHLCPWLSSESIFSCRDLERAKTVQVHNARAPTTMYAAVRYVWSLISISPHTAFASLRDAFLI